jgi:hypothetical protein
LNPKKRLKNISAIMTVDDEYVDVEVDVEDVDFTVTVADVSGLFVAISTSVIVNSTEIRNYCEIFIFIVYSKDKGN